jgi:hypothetical protein
MITAPILAQREVVTGRCLFAHIHWGVPGGFTAGSIYLDTKDGMGPVNTAYLWKTVKAPARFNSEGVDWLIGGDWNNQPAELFSSSWATAASAIPFCPKAPTCRQANPGTVLDYFLVSSNLAARVDSNVRVDEEATLYPHCPVHLQVLGQDYLPAMEDGAEAAQGTATAGPVVGVRGSLTIGRLPASRWPTMLKGLLLVWTT